MPLDPNLVELLRCPQCKGTMDLAPDESSFSCHACRLRYSITNGIPVLLVHEAQPISSPEKSEP